MTLVLTAHGSADPRSAANAQAVVGRLTRLRPGLDVRLAFLEGYLSANDEDSDILPEDQSHIKQLIALFAGHLPRRHLR